MVMPREDDESGKRRGVREAEEEGLKGEEEETYVGVEEVEGKV